MHVCVCTSRIWIAVHVTFCTSRTWQHNECVAENVGMLPVVRPVKVIEVVGGLTVPPQMTLPVESATVTALMPVSACSAVCRSVAEASCLMSPVSSPS